MSVIHRPAMPALRSLVASVWATAPEAGRAGPVAGAREHVLPTGATHIAVRLGGPVLRIFDDLSDHRGHRLGHAVVGGPRVSYHVRDVSEPAASVGAMLRPGAAFVLLGAPESALAGHHTPLEFLLGPAAVAELHGQLEGGRAAADALARFERWLLARARGRGPILHGSLASLLSQPRVASRVQPLVRASGLSHRHFIALFRQSTGLTPGQWLRLQRFAAALDMAATTSCSWAEVAASSGFADQAHLANTFRTTTGFTPSAWRAKADLATPRHVRV